MDIPKDVKKLLGPNEEVKLYLRQKIFHPKFNIESIAITNERVILRAPHAFGMLKNYEDFSYHNIANIKLHKGVLRSRLSCELLFGGEPLDIDDLPNSWALEAYGLIRENLTRIQSGLGLVPGIQMTGASRVAATVCPKCATSIATGQAFCGHCGTKI